MSPEPTPWYGCLIVWTMLVLSGMKIGEFAYDIYYWIKRRRNRE